MSQERDEIFIPHVPTKDELLDATFKAMEGKEENPANETREQRKARRAAVLERGVINDILDVPNLPKDKYHGEWVRADPMQVRAMQALGFWIDTEYATKRVTHSDGTSGNRVGDVIFMVTDRENKELIDEIRDEQRKRAEYRGKRAEHEFQSATARDTGGEIPTFVESRTEVAPLQNLTGALSRIDTQTKPQK